MTTTHLLTSFRGRIGRAQFWHGCVWIACLSALLSFVIEGARVDYWALRTLSFVMIFSAAVAAFMTAARAAGFI